MEQSKKPTILVVDDEADLLEILKSDLEEVGYRVLTANSGNTAFKISQNEKIDLVLSDVKMPDGTGHELLQKLKASPQDSPAVLFMSGHAEFSTKDAKIMGAGGLIAKPWDPADLLKRINDLLHSKPQRWQRKSIRYKFDWNVLLKARPYSGALATQILNIGIGGMFIVSSSPYPTTGVETHFSFRLPTGRSIEGSAVVRWVRKEGALSLPTGFGLEFKNLTQKQINDLENAVQGGEKDPEQST